MDNLILNGTKTTPSVNFNYESGELFISGESYPENASVFYQNLISWINDYINQKKAIKLNLKFVYFNTSSSKAIMDLVEILDQYHKQGGLAELNWYYEEDDEDIYESGVEFTDNLSLPTKLIAYS